MSTEPARRATWWIVAGICALALALRVYALNYGLPDVLNPDEIPILNRALAFGKGSLNPKNFLYPSLYFYALFAWEAAFFVAGRLTGLFHSLSDFERQFFVDHSRHVLAGRALTAAFGVLTVAAVYRLGARLYDRTTGIAAALLLAVAPLAVRDAHYVKQDVPVTLFIVLTQLACARLVVDAEAASRRWAWLVAGAMAGLALSTHYYAFPVIAPIIVAAAIDAGRTGDWRGSFRMLVWAGISSIVAFFATTPFLLVEIPTAVRDMVAVRQLDIDRTPGVIVAMRAYGRLLTADAMGWGAPALALAGAAIALATDWRRGVLLLAFPIAFLIFLSHTLPMSRYANALLPSVALAGALAATRISRRRRLLLVLLLIGAAGPALIASIDTDRFLRRQDTRTQAREFLEARVPPGSAVLIQPHGVQLRPSREGLLEALRTNLGSESLASVKFQKQLEAAANVTPAFRLVYLGDITDGGQDPEKIYVSPRAFAGGAGLQALRDRRVAYVAIERYNRPFEPLYAALQRDARLLATFSPYRADASPDQRAAVAPFFHNTADRIGPALERPGPVVDVWRIE
jgi:hypothetical protein